MPSPAPQPARRCEGTRGRSSPASRLVHGHAGGKVARGRAPQPAPTLLVLPAIMTASDRWCSCRRLRPESRLCAPRINDLGDFRFAIQCIQCA